MSIIILFKKKLSAVLVSVTNIHTGLNLNSPHKNKMGDQCGMYVCGMCVVCMYICGMCMMYCI